MPPKRTRKPPARLEDEYVTENAPKAKRSARDTKAKKTCKARQTRRLIYPTSRRRTTTPAKPSRAPQMQDSTTPRSNPKPPPPAKLDVMLDKALKRASRDRLESTLRSICADHPDALKDVDSALVKTTEVTAPAGRKRRPGHLICMNPGCDAEYDPSTNGAKSCTWHSGEIEVDEGEWDDWEECTHGSIDTAENREEYPKGFAWDCCWEKLNSKKLGCVKGPHAETVTRRRIRKERVSLWDD